MGSAQQEVGYSGLFKKHMLWNLKYSSQDFQHRAPNPVTWSQDIGDAKLRRDFWYLEWCCPWRGDELWRELRYRKCLIKSTYIVWFWSQFSGLFGVWSRSHRCDNYEGKVIAPPTAAGSVSFSKCFEFSILLLPNLLQTSQNNVKKRPMWNCQGILISKYCCHGNVSNLNISSGDFEALKMFRIS